jgi:hypothetical protein
MYCLDVHVIYVIQAHIFSAMVARAKPWCILPVFLLLLIAGDIFANDSYVYIFVSYASDTPVKALVKDKFARVIPTLIYACMFACVVP